MKKHFKRLVASVMAVSSLSACITGFNANATDGSGYVYNSSGTTLGTASLSVTTTFVRVKTTSKVGVCDTITAKVTSTTGATISGDKSISTYDDTEAAITCNVVGATKATSYHYIEDSTSSKGSKNLSVTR